MANEKDANRGGAYGQEGDLSQNREVVGSELPGRKKAKQTEEARQQGGISKEPDLEPGRHEKQPPQPKHQVD